MTEPNALAPTASDTTPAEPPRPRRLPSSVYRTVSPETWRLIRGAYLSGLSAPTVAARFGVSEGAIRKRARREGWTKRQFAERATPWNLCLPRQGAGSTPRAGSLDRPPPRSAFDASDPPLRTGGEGEPPLTEDDIVAAWSAPLRILPNDLARRTLAAAAQAVKTGHALNAQRLARAANEIARLDALMEFAGDDPAAAEERAVQQQRMTRLFLRERALKLAQDLIAGRDLPQEYQELKAELARLEDIRLAEEAASMPAPPDREAV